jgi:hypothetical protein
MENVETSVACDKCGKPATWALVTIEERYSFRRNETWEYSYTLDDEGDLDDIIDSTLVDEEGEDDDLDDSETIDET